MTDAPHTREPARSEPPAAASHAPHAVPSASRHLNDGISPLQFANVLLSHWRAVVGLPVAAAVLAAGISLIIRPVYTATTSFVPESGSQGGIPGGLTGLAGQLGISLSVEASSSPRFYADVVRSRGILERVLLARYPDPRSSQVPPDSATLLDILEGREANVTSRLPRAVSTLAGMVSTRVDNQTNVIRLSVDSRYPALAAQVANQLVSGLNEFNAQTRQSQARQRRRFAEARLAEAERDLGNAEQELRGFYERNRTWAQSPQLTFDEGRLRRQVEIRQEVYLTLRREFETARIQEVNETPVITVIDAAVPPRERSKPRRRPMVIVALVLGGLAGVFWASGIEYMRRMQQQEVDEYQRFRQLVQRLRAALRV